MRIASAVVSLIAVSHLIADPDGLTFATTAWLVALMSVNMAAPRWLYDGRGTAWFRRHPVLGGLIVFAMMAPPLYFLLSPTLEPAPSALIASLSAGIVSAVGHLRDRQLARRSD
ncbi:hypothetical protein Kfla_5295 [Kribbella flavida DSM 17836]|uniref:Uncharacterized protein n=1 Tax=Kribbella flavida (strain DSM 17836 / JCM 10339 / NBRC 14399) TaxID=479435 RepID=D2PL54_KRIFD|nr:hypothetical protein [Kribbella flavida]ADB34309.1 hypothetical protein Kfla_5295 [Kribbella flavida DSM 17836]